jgi:MoaA/NifB/PqqE/SkfB family radical SAM enzyme
MGAYYRALCGLGDFPPVRCNAPEFSAVIEADGALRPCFFIPGPDGKAPGDLAGALNAPAMQRLRADIRARRRSECTRCVCAKWRDPASAEEGHERGVR